MDSFNYVDTLSLGAQFHKQNITKNLKGQMKLFYIFEDILDFDEVNKLWLEESRCKSDVFEQLREIRIQPKVLICLNRKVCDLVSSEGIKEEWRVMDQF